MNSKRRKRTHLKSHLPAFLESIGANPPNVYRTLARLAEHGDGHEQTLAINYIGVMRFEGAVKLLVRIIENDPTKFDESVTVIGACTEALGMIDSRHSHEALKYIIASTELHWLRYFAIDSLGYEEISSEPELILQILRENPDAHLREAAMWAVFEQAWLGRFGFYEEDVLLAFQDKDPCVRSSVIECLHAAGMTDKYLQRIAEITQDRGKCPKDGSTTVGAKAREYLRLYGWELSS